MGDDENRQEGWIYCTGCGKKVGAESVFCESCGCEIEKEMRAGRSFLPRFNRLPLRRGRRGGLVFLILALFFCLAAAAAAIGGGRRTETASPRGFTGYVKDNSLYGIDGRGTGEEYTDFYISRWQDRERLSLPYLSTSQPAGSGRGATLWYPARIGDSSFTLMQRKGEKEEKADSGVVSFQAAGERAVYEKNNGGLYLIGPEGKEKLAAGVKEYRLKQDGSLALWLEETGAGLYDLWIQKLEPGEERQRIDRGIAYLAASDSLDSLMYQKDGDIWLWTADGQKERLAEHTGELYAPDPEDGTVFFTRPEEGALYYVENGRETQIDDSFLFLIHREEGLLLYKRSGEEGEEFAMAVPRGWFALEYEPAAGSPPAVWENAVWYLGTASPGEGASPEKPVSPGETASPEESASPGETESPEGSASSEKPAALIRVSLAEEDFGQAEEMAEEAGRFIAATEEGPVYLGPLFSGCGDLFQGDRLAAYDVLAASVRQEPGQPVFYCIADYDPESESGSLVRVTGRGTEKLAERVSGYGLTEEGEVYFFSDSDISRGRGNLYFCSRGGSQAELVDRDVWGLYLPTEEGESLLRQTDIR